MSRVAVILSVAVVLLSAGIAYGDVRGEVVSYYAGRASGQTLISSVPAGGVVLTDFVGVHSGQFWLKEDGEDMVMVAGRDLAGDGSTHLLSGIKFTAGSTVTFHHDQGDTRPMTISGYIPCPETCGPQPLVPAVSTVGLGVMLLAVLGAGGVVFARRGVRRW